MANETLTSNTIVVYNEIPQTLQESLISGSIIVMKDIPQTLQESLISGSIIVMKDIPQTLQESFITSTIVVSQVSDRPTTSKIGKCGLSMFSLNNIAYPFSNNFGFMRIKIPNSQILI
jgi:hypothetical protein